MTRFFDSFLQDLRYGLRIILANRTFAVVVLLTLTLSIGVNTFFFGLVYGVLLRPLRFPNSDRLVSVSGYYPRGAFLGLAHSAHSAEYVAYSPPDQSIIKVRASFTRAESDFVSARLLSVLGTPPELGRIFVPGDDAPDRDNLVILSHSLWLSQLGGDRNVIGQNVEIDGVSREIVGVMPEAFRFPSAETALWIPAEMNPANRGQFWGPWDMQIVGRLAAGLTVKAAHAEIKTLIPAVRAMFPYPMPPTWAQDTRVTSLRDAMVGDVRDRVVLLFMAALLVLLIASVNIANLFITRAMSRETEFGVRLAVGAPRARIVRQVLTESVLVAFLGGAFGLALAFIGVKELSHIFPAGMPRLADVAIGFRVIGYLAGLCIVVGLIFGYAPALRSVSGHVEDKLRITSRAVFGSRKRGRLSAALMVAEVALATMVLVNTGLIVNSLVRLSHANPGFVAERLMAVDVLPAKSRCAASTACVSFYSDLIRRVHLLPGVQDVAAVNVLPISGDVAQLSAEFEGHPVRPGAPPPLVWKNDVTPEYFRTLRIPLISGREFTELDGPQSQRVVIINASLARRMWPGESAIGKHLRPVSVAHDSVPWWTVVGVLGDVKEYSLAQEQGWYVGEVYLPYAQSLVDTPQPSMTLVVRAGGDTTGLSEQIRSTIAASNPGAPVFEVKTMKAVISQSIAIPRSTAWLFTTFAVLAALLAISGVYAVTASLVQQRSHEMGLRLALGADQRSILQLVLSRGFILIFTGMVIGLIGAAASGRLISRFLYGVTSTDLATYLAVAGGLALFGILACYLPARTVLNLDPNVALRQE